MVYRLRRRKRDADEYDYPDILVDVARWMAKNPDLVASDEWLQTIANRMSDNGTLMSRLEE